MVDEHLADRQANYVDKGALSSQMNQIWIWILGLISTYLGKQIYSAKKDGKRDQRIALLEKLLQRDIDGDGIIGGEPELSGDSTPAEV